MMRAHTTSIATRVDAGGRLVSDVLDGGSIEVAIARERWRPAVNPVSSEQAAAIIGGYERRNRLIALFIRRVLSCLAGLDDDGSDEARRRLVNALPLVALRQHE